MPDDKRSTPLGIALAKRAMQVRHARGLSMKYVEDEIGMARGLLSKIENGQRAIRTSVGTVVDMARLYQVDVGWFITGIRPDGNWYPPELDPTVKNVPGRRGARKTTAKTTKKAGKVIRPPKKR